jgi:hypothetical protein
VAAGAARLRAAPGALWAFGQGRGESSGPDAPRSLGSRQRHLAFALQLAHAPSSPLARSPFPGFQKTGNTGEYTKKIQADTDAAMRNIQISVDANKEKIITSLLQSVTTVSI